MKLVSHIIAPISQAQSVRDTCICIAAVRIRKPSKPFWKSEKIEKVLWKVPQIEPSDFRTFKMDG